MGFKALFQNALILYGLRMQTENPSPTTYMRELFSGVRSQPTVKYNILFFTPKYKSPISVKHI